MTKAWSAWKRKKTEENGVVKLLKIDGQKAVEQYAVNWLKPLFGVRPLEIELVLDEETGKIGQFQNWIPALCNVGKMKSWLMASENMREIIRILLFDAVIGNNDRMTCNVLVDTNYRVFAIDEGDVFRWKAPIKVKFRREFRDPILSHARTLPEWLTDLLRALPQAKSPVSTRLTACGTSPADVNEVVNRLNRIQDIFRILFYGAPREIL